MHSHSAEKTDLEFCTSHEDDTNLANVSQRESAFCFAMLAVELSSNRSASDPVDVGFCLG